MKVESVSTTRPPEASFNPDRFAPNEADLALDPRSGGLASAVPVPDGEAGQGPRPRVVARIRAFGRPPRIMGIDVARGLALLGMMAAHMAQPPVLNWADPSTWGGVVSGRSAILFAVLAGVSIALTNGRRTIPSPSELPRLRLRLLGRSAAIFLIGVTLELLNTGVAVILGVYSLLFVAAIPFLRFRVRDLLIAAGCFAVGGPFLLAVLDVLSLNAQGPSVNLALFGVYPLPVWMALLLLGMAIGRLRVDSTRVAVWTLVAGIGLAAVGYLGGAAVAGTMGLGQGTDSSLSGNGGSEDFETVPGEQVDARGMECYEEPGAWISCVASGDAGSAPSGMSDGYLESLASMDPGQQILSSSLAVWEHSGGVFEIVGSGGFALAVIGACLLLARPLRWLLIPIAALGSMPLSSYAAHLVVYLVLAGQPLAPFPGGVATWAWVSAGLVAAATVWAFTMGRGPLERLVARSANWMARGA